MKKAALALCLGVLASLAVIASCSRAPQDAAAAHDGDIAIIARARAIIDALKSADPAAYEKAAKENFAASLYAERTPDERAGFVRMIAGDLGRMRIDNVETDGETVDVALAGDTGMIARFRFEFEDAPERKISRIGVSADAGDGAGAAIDIPPPAFDASMDANAIGAALDEWLAPVIDADDFAGVILIARNGDPLIRRITGAADRKSGAQADAETAYNIASIGKIFTKIAIAKLVEDGRLSLDAKISDVISDYPNAVTATASVRQLLDMEAGVADFFGPKFETQAKDRFASNHAYYDFVSAEPATFAPGEARAYCNGCYVVLGEMIERIADEPYEAFVQRAVFDPAGMKRSGYFNARNAHENVARLYARADGPGSGYIDAQDRHGDAGSAAGGVYSTADDLLKFDNALREGRLLNGAMTVWALGGGDEDALRNPSPMGLAGGADGTNALLESNGEWTVILTANVSEPVPEQLGLAIARALMK
ncbi:MAG: serine hydrolase domain-containing protein [Parvularculaceae bacterium]|nr:beta-lactamase family protein [Parvularculaceae bacterium]